MGLVHARDSALGKVAAIGTVNPRHGGLANSVVQAWKRLVARVLDWHVREQVEFNRQVLGCLDAAIEAFNEDNRALVELGNRIRAAVEGSQENLRAAQESLGQDIQAAQEGLRQEFGAIQESLGQSVLAAQEALRQEFKVSLGQDIQASQEGLRQEFQAIQESLGQDVLAAQEGLRQEFKVIQESIGQDIQAAQESLGRDIQATQENLGRDIRAAQEGLGQEIRMVQESLGPEMADIRKHWAEWRAGWEHKLAQNEIQFLRSVADLQGAFQHRVTLMDTSFRETVRGQHAEFTAELERSAVEIQKRLWLEFERTIHAELRIIRQRSQIPAADVAGAGHAQPLPAGASPEPAPLAFDMARFALCFRGSEEYVKAGQRQYVPNFEGCQNVLDIGCGRGEFLEIMREANIPAVGIDLSREPVAMCRLKGLEAETADLFTYLAGLTEESLDGIFCAQVVEHLPPERLPEMIQLCASRLARDGVMVIETPNPECLAIFATHFYLDPTHARPVPHPLLAFYLEEFGVGVVEVRKLAPAVESMPSLELLPEAFRDAFFGGLDYAIIGKKL
jgi:O-antigen chain-terminating methyltransferase